MDNYDVGKSNDKDVNVHDNPLNLSHFNSGGFKVSNLSMCFTYRVQNLKVSNL